jgi:hypothetical protein
MLGKSLIVTLFCPDFDNILDTSFFNPHFRQCQGIKPPLLTDEKLKEVITEIQHLWPEC